MKAIVRKQTRSTTEKQRYPADDINFPFQYMLAILGESTTQEAVLWNTSNYRPITSTQHYSVQCRSPSVRRNYHTVDRLGSTRSLGHYYTTPCCIPHGARLQASVAATWAYAIQRETMP